nr:MAG TPA: hypothetical protein [Caudoviricetes sp.]
MAKFYGKIGFAVTEETKPDVWEEVVTERTYFGDVTRDSRRREQSSESINDDLNIGNEISIVADPYATENIHNMRYVTFWGSRWKINNVEGQYPRLNISIGGLYNGKEN